METTDKTNGVEQEIVKPQDITTANEADSAIKTTAANNAEEPEHNDNNSESQVISNEEESEDSNTDKTEITADEDIVSEAISSTDKETSTDESSNKDVNSDTANVETSENDSNTKSDELSKDISTEVNANEEVNSGTTKAKATEDEIDTKSDELAAPDYSKMNFEELVAKMVELVASDNVAIIKNDIGEIKSQYIKKIKQVKQNHFDKFISDGGKESEYETIKFDFEQQYQTAYETYKEKKKAYTKIIEAQKEENYKTKKALLESLRAMINSEENLNKIYHEFKDLQNKWREIGQVPQNQTKDLWENYHFLVEKFFEKVEINKELMMIGLSKNLEEKIVLCEKTEDLLLEKSINKSFSLLQEYHERWKEIGPVPKDKNDEIWERFKTATDKVNHRRHEYYENLHEEQKSNLLLKTELCERAEAYNEEPPTTLTAWNKRSEEINKLMEEWKTIGPAPKKYNDTIWKRFKGAINDFYNTKKSFISKIKDEQMNNYHLKLDLIAQVEAIKNSEDWKKTTLEIINIQRKWKEIGQVPRKYSDKLWKTFRTHCDDFFNRKEDFFKNIGKIETENKAGKIALIEEIKAYEFGENKEDNLKAIKEFQRRWIEIGKVPIKDKSRLQSEFKAIINKHLTNLNINILEFENSGLKAKIASMKNKEDADRLIRKEITSYKSKIEHLQKDLILWENNISFFANSKNADLLKADFEKKINKAKKEVDVLKAKIRQFDKMLRELKS